MKIPDAADSRERSILGRADICSHRAGGRRLMEDISVLCKHNKL